jgi:hypothetical protein
LAVRGLLSWKISLRESMGLCPEAENSYFFGRL